jgi:hypothetical protein
MYDDIFCECDLPDGLRPEEKHFQTNSLYTSHDRSAPCSALAFEPSLITDELPGITHRSSAANA